MSDKNESSENYIKSTPPTNKKVRNPFDKPLIDRLHKPICSPGMCQIYKRKNNGSFRWDIDQACALVPADIVACNSQFEPSPDPALERIAEEATEKFFSQEMVMPSPQVESSKIVKPLFHTSSDVSIKFTSFAEEKTVILRDVSAQTVLTLPPELPPEIEKILQPFCTFTQDQNISGDYEITANGSLRRKLFFEEHSDIEHYDSEQTDDEGHVGPPRPPSSYEAHTPVVFSPDLCRDLVAKGMKRTFGTPIKKDPLTNGNGKSCFRNKILEAVEFGEPCFSPIQFQTPKRTDLESGASSSLASASISPVTKAASSDEEKNVFTSPESEAMATCLDCIVSDAESEKKGPCYCKTPNKSILKRSASLKESSPQRCRKGSFTSIERSASLSSLHRSRSVQKLDFSLDMSIDGSFHNNLPADSVSNSPQGKQVSWSIVEEAGIRKAETTKEQIEIQSSTKIHSINILEETPIKGKTHRNVLSHEISKIRASTIQTPLHMSLDNSFDNIENPLHMEDKKIDFNTVDLKFLTENISKFDYTCNNAGKSSDSSVSFKRVDSGFNENTFYANASSYYESAIKPSELTVTDTSRANTSKTALKEISNVNWMRLDSGFKDENSADGTQFYPGNDSSMKKVAGLRFSEANLDDKENIATEDFDRFLGQVSSKNEAMSMSDIFNDEMTFNCNFSSTPSKNKSRKIQS